MTLEELKKYVTSNKRICPMQPVWAKIGEIITIQNKFVILKL